MSTFLKIVLVEPSLILRSGMSYVLRRLTTFDVQVVETGEPEQWEELIAEAAFDAVVSIYDTAEQIKEKLRSVCNSRDGEASQELLSAREKEIIVGVVKGLTNKQIAERLFISAHTVITHRRNIAAKLQIHSPAGLTIYAIVNKLVELNDVKNTIYSNEEQ